MDEKINEVDEKINKVDIEIKKASEKVLELLDFKSKDNPKFDPGDLQYWRKEKEDLRKKEEDLRRKEILLLEKSINESESKF